MKIDFYSVPDTLVSPIQYAPSEAGVDIYGGGWIGGNATHTGLVNLEESYYTMIECSFNTDLYQLTTVAVGKITAANKDYYFYRTTIVTQLPEHTCTGEVIINDGTGKFKGATGTIPIKGFIEHPSRYLYFTGEGTITLVVGENHKK